MKKIININLSGRVIPIEDMAYEKLQQYIESLRRYFANEEGRDEIINDIEGRIAELMSDKVRKGAESITEQDLEDIILSMGRVEDFEAADQDAAAAAAGTTTSAKTGEEQSHTYQSAPKRERGRLYRDTNDKFIGGVCSGIAAYMNVDPAIVRILFAIISFGGFGFGFLAYIILWIVLPPKDLEGFVGKRLYRNPDDRVIGGVAGGLAAYFGKSANTIRLIFAAPILLSIIIRIINKITWDSDFSFAMNLGLGSITGTFIITYILLWIVLPEAVSDYQKMEMRGETVDINRIRQNVREGMGNMKVKMKGWSDEVKSSARDFSNKAKEFAGTRGREFAQEFNETARRGGRGLGHAIGVIFKAFFLFIAGTIAVGLFVAVIALLFGGVAWWPVNGFLWTSNWQQLLAWATLILFLVVPLVGFIIWIIRRITSARSRSNYLGWTFGGLWTLGWIAMIFFVSSIVRDFRQYEDNEVPVNISQPANDKLIVAVSQPELEYTGNFGWMNDGSSGWDISDDTLKIGAVKFTVDISPDNLYYVKIRKYSFGRTSAEAESRAEKIQFSVSSQDSILDIANGYAIDKNSKFRGQNVEVQIRVPANKKIRFDESVKRKLNSINVKVKRSNRKNRIAGVEIEDDERAFQYRTNMDYVMGSDGILRGPDGEKARELKEDGYRYREDNDTGRGNNNDEEIRKQLEEEKRKKEESDKRIKDLEEKLKTSKPGTGSRKKEVKGIDGAFAAGPSPVSAVSLWF